MSPPSSKQAPFEKPAPPAEWLTGIVPLLLVVLGIASAGAVILLGDHASQAQPQIAHLYRATENNASTATPGATPRKLLGRKDDANPCLPVPPPQYHDIYGQAKIRDRIIWLLVHEGDQAATVQALTTSVGRHGGYAVANPSPFGNPSRVGILASDRWHQDHLDPLQPYGARPRPRAGDEINTGYIAWATAVLNEQMPEPAPVDWRQCELRPTVVAVNQKPVGEITDTRTKAGAWLLIGFATVVTIGGLYALRPVPSDR